MTIALAPYIYTELLVLTIMNSYIFLWATGVIEIPDYRK